MHFISDSSFSSWTKWSHRFRQKKTEIAIPARDGPSNQQLRGVFCQMCASVWVYVSLCESVWVCVRLCESVWVCVSLCESVCVVHVEQSAAEPHLGLTLYTVHVPGRNTRRRTRGSWQCLCSAETRQSDVHVGFFNYRCWTPAAFRWEKQVCE